jgi:hypothetical protein
MRLNWIAIRTHLAGTSPHVGLSANHTDGCDGSRIFRPLQRRLANRWEGAPDLTAAQSLTPAAPSHPTKPSAPLLWFDVAGQGAVSSWVRSLAGSGLAYRKPWPTSQPSARSSSA